MAKELTNQEIVDILAEYVKATKQMRECLGFLMAKNDRLEEANMRLLQKNTDLPALTDEAATQSPAPGQGSAGAGEGRNNNGE